jgi:hypothetical protein
MQENIKATVNQITIESLVALSSSRTAKPENALLGGAVKPTCKELSKSTVYAVKIKKPERRTNVKARENLI